jgi:hypothetical protein
MAHPSGITRTIQEFEPQPKKAIAKQFAKIQKRAAIIISGAFQATAAEALDIELYLLPMKMQLEARAKEAAVRIVTGPAIGYPPAWKETRPRREHAISTGTY